MNDYPNYINNEMMLEELLSRPTPQLIEMMKKIDGDFIFLGVAGKLGISMVRMAKRACEEAGVEKRIIGVSRFSTSESIRFLEGNGIETIKGDLLNSEFINELPDIKNVVFLAGMKFGTEGNESVTWAMNSYLPGLVAEKYKNSIIVALSTGCVYPMVDVKSSGSLESDTPDPIGEYAQSCLGRERLFEYGSIKNGTPVALIRLNYAVEMRYGVLVDIALKVYNGEAVDLAMGYANVIWQADANSQILLSFQYCQSPARPFNVTGEETLSIRKIAVEFGKLMNKKVEFVGLESQTALLANPTESNKLLGIPQVQLSTVLKWTAKWIEKGNRILGKPTHFEVRDGKY
jgi:hypothetical protein